MYDYHFIYHIKVLSKSASHQNNSGLVLGWFYHVATPE